MYDMYDLLNSIAIGLHACAAACIGVDRCLARHGVVSAILVKQLRTPLLKGWWSLNDTNWCAFHIYVLGSFLWSTTKASWPDGYPDASFGTCTCDTAPLWALAANQIVMCRANRRLFWPSMTYYRAGWEGFRSLAPLKRHQGLQQWCVCRWSRLQCTCGR